MTKQWVPIQIPLAGGLETKGDARAGNPPGFDILRDAQFDEVGGLQTRKPYAAIGSDIFGGTTLTDIRRIVENGDELLCFTATALYSWNAQLSKWVLKGTHLAAEIDEVSRFVTPGDQVDCDRAELGGTIVYTWADGANGYVAALDKTTGSVLMAPQSIGPASRLRVTALTTKILLTFADAAGEWYCWALDPAAPATALGGASTTIYNTGTSANSYYDVVKIPGADAAILAGRFNPTTSYLIAKITAGLAVTTSTKARTCDGPIAISCEPTGTSAQIVRASSTNIEGDLITISTLADVYTAQAIGTVGGTPVHQIAAAHRSVQDSGVYRCYVFWNRSSGSAGTPTGGTKYNWVSTGNTLGTEGLFGSSSTDEQLSVASRAFDYNGRIYVWLVFAGTSIVGSSKIALQNTYFLFRDDVFLTAKASPGISGGTANSISWLPGISAVSSSEYAWCGTERRTVPLGGGSNGYAARGPRDILIEFDSDRARRTARLGKTLYIAGGGEVLTYDGTRLVECGFHITPFRLTILHDAGTGDVENGTRAFKESWRWENAQGETDRSSTAAIPTSTMTLGPGHYDFTLLPITATHKHITGALPARDIWRTVVDPTDESPFYLVTSRDPAAADPNGYVDTDDTAASDALADTSIVGRETNPENGSVLENLAPPAATIILAAQDRLFLAGVAGDPDRVWYSKQRADGEVAAFHDALVIDVPAQGGAITALAFFNETLVVLRETAIYMFQGQGFSNLGTGQNYGPGMRIPGDIGAINMESVAVTPIGLFLKSSKGFYVLTSGWACDYVGAAVAEFDADEVRAVHVVEAQHQIRVLTSARMLVLDYLVKQWVEWTVTEGADATMWRGTHHYANSDEVLGQLTTFTGVDYGMDVELAWIKLNDLQGAGSVRWLNVLGEYRGAHKLRVRIARDYKADYYQDKTCTPYRAVVGGPEQISIGPKISKCQAIKVRLTAVHTDGSSVPNNEALKLTGLGLEVGIDRGLNRRLAAAQKA